MYQLLHNPTKVCTIHATISQNPLEPEFSLKGQAQIMHGNVLYEWSQILAAVEGEWRPVLDQAVAAFTDAGCNAGDIRNALKNHTQVQLAED